MTESKIEWCNRSDWNPIRGCTRVSPGCGGPGPHGGCYAEAIAARFSDPGQPFHGFAERTKSGPHWTGKVELLEDRLTLPLRWRKPARIFASSTSDIFHEALPDEAIDRIFAVMALAPQHTFQILTKRAKRMREYLAAAHERIANEAMESAPVGRDIAATGLIFAPRERPSVFFEKWPLPNVWLGVSVEDQARADERIPHLLRTPAAVRFVSAEPLLGPVIFRVPFPDGDSRNLHDALTGEPLIYGTGVNGNPDILVRCSSPKLGKLDWVIAGSESGRRARYCDVAWVRSLRDQCVAASVSFFWKQHVVNGKKIGLPVLDGREWSEMPS